MKKIALAVVLGIVVLIALVLGIGAMIPQDHIASMSARYDQPADTIWRMITDYESFPEWRSTVDEVEPFGDAGGWLERGTTGALPLAVDEATPPRRLVLRIAADNLGFGGTWTYEIRDDAAGSSLTITENGTVTNLFFRFMSRFVFGYHANLETYLVDLGRHFGQEITPRVVDGT